MLCKGEYSVLSTGCLKYLDMIKSIGKMKILNLNRNHCAAAQNLLKQTVLEESIDVALLSEQYTQFGKHLD